MRHFKFKGVRFSERPAKQTYPAKPIGMFSFGARD